MRSIGFSLCYKGVNYKHTRLHLARFRCLRLMNSVSNRAADICTTEHRYNPDRLSSVNECNELSATITDKTFIIKHKKMIAEINDETIDITRTII